MVAKVLAGAGVAVATLGLLLRFVVVPGMAVPAAYGANIGAGLLVLFSLVLLGGGLLATTAGAIFWVRDRRRSAR